MRMTLTSPVFVSSIEICVGISLPSIFTHSSRICWRTSLPEPS
jgi:hypothetical protein